MSSSKRAAGFLYHSVRLARDPRWGEAYRSGRRATRASRRPRRDVPSTCGSSGSRNVVELEPGARRERG